MPRTSTPTPKKKPRLPPDARHEPHGGGRLPENDVIGPPIPKVTQAQVEAVNEWVITHRDLPGRWLGATAATLAMVCAIHEQESYFPARRRVAEWMHREGYTASDKPNAVDKAISVAAALEELHIEWGTEEGEVSVHASIRRHRYLVPSRELFAAYKSAASPSFGRAATKPRRNPGLEGDVLLAALKRRTG
jgi:hypothetical protein